MRALVVHESLFGNTEAIARAVGEGLARHLTVDVVAAAEAPVRVASDVALLVVGAPTHAFGLPSQGTRASAVREYPDLRRPRQPGVREWLEHLEADPATTLTAAFDTRIDKRWIPGAASHRIHRALSRLGMRSAAPARSFFVHDTEGPLLDGEAERARDWGERLARVTRSVQHQQARQRLFN
jgi:hypothetical protein